MPPRADRHRARRRMHAIRRASGKMAPATRRSSTRAVVGQSPCHRASEWRSIPSLLKSANNSCRSDLSVFSLELVSVWISPVAWENVDLKVNTHNLSRLIRKRTADQSKVSLGVDERIGMATMKVACCEFCVFTFIPASSEYEQACAARPAPENDHVLATSMHDEHQRPGTFTRVVS